MNRQFSFSRHDVQRIVQSMAKPLLGQSQTAADAVLFTEITNLSAFLPERRADLAEAVLRFFCLDGDAAAAHDLRVELVSHTGLESWAAMVHGLWRAETARFHSSGSTGTPVWHELSLALMAEEMAVLEPVFASRSRIVSVMPAHHVYGFMYGVLMSKWISVPVLYAPPLPLAAFFDTLRQGDIIVGFPLFWNALLSVIQREDNELSLPPNITGLTATAPCPIELIRNLLSRSRIGKGEPLADMNEIYGSTENMAMGLRRGGNDWFDLLPLWEAPELPDGSRGLRRVRADGTRWEAEPFPDVVSWNAERPGTFKPERRTDKAVQVGGLNVYPERVAAVIRTYPHVRDCAVRLMRPEEGTRLKAFIVPDIPLDDAQEHFGKPFRNWLAENLETVARPKHIRLGVELPRNSMGKASDWD